MKIGRGYARGNFRADSVDWNPLEISGLTGDVPLSFKQRKKNGSGAAEARRRMLERMERENTESGENLTSQVVRDYMGGLNGGARQAAEYQTMVDRIKATGQTGSGGGSLADAARRRMIERHESRPDIGRDKANRRAYPPLKTDGTKPRTASGDEMARVFCNARFK